MTKRYHKRHSKGGGFFDSIKQSFNNLSSSVQSSASSMWNKTKKATTSYQPSATTSYQPSATTYGGSRRKRTRRRLKGGYKPSHSINNIAATAAPIHGLQTARAHSWVGGRRKKRTRIRHYK